MSNIIIWSVVFLSVCVITFYIIKSKSNKRTSLPSSTSNDNIGQNQPWVVKETDLSVARAQDIPLNAPLKSAVQDIFRYSMPQAVKKANGKQLFELTFDPEIVEGLKNGQYKLMNSKQRIGAKRAMAVNRQGDIAGQGSLTKYKNLKGMAMNALTVAVSQEHLQEIREELTTIKVELEALKAIEMDKHYGTAKGALDYFQRASSYYEELQEIPEKIQVKLEHIYLQSLQSAQSLIKMTSHHKNDIQKLKRSVFWNTEKQVDAFKRIADEFEKTQTYQGLHIRNLMIFIKFCELSGDPITVVTSNLAKVNELVQKNIEAVNEVIEEGKNYSMFFKARFRTTKHLSSQKTEMEHMLKYLESIKSPEKMMDMDHTPPKQMIVELVDGEVQHISKVSE